MIKSFSDLKANDIVEIRTGKMMMVFELNGKKILINYEDYLDGKYFSKSNFQSDISNNFDIVRVRRPDYPIQLKQPNWNLARVIWEEKGIIKR